MKEASLKITEIFYSLQGESSTVGFPTVFVRLTGCPLRCRYCDTEYAFSGGKKQTLTEIIEQVEQFNPRYVTVTGGEPLAQNGCHQLLTLLADKGYQVSLETSGAIDISNVDPRVVTVMDLKTPASDEMDRNLYQNIEKLAEKDQLKFVIADENDYQWSKSMIEKYALADRCEILFSPVSGVMSETGLAENIIHDNLPVRFQIQLHKHLWLDAQGK